MAAITQQPGTLMTKEADIQIMMAAEVHLGTKNCDNSVGNKSRKLKKSCRDKLEKMHDTEDIQEDVVAEDAAGSSEDSTHEKKKKRVKFSGQVQIFPSLNDPSDEKHEIEEENLLRGKRFSKLEDEIVKEAVHKYIEIHNLGEEGLKKVLNARSYPEIKDCWKEIGRAIPYRPSTAVYSRAQILFRRSDSRNGPKKSMRWYESSRKSMGTIGGS
ncbi:hypothetical protein R3W88_009329 [Solanum pinnatisectum]|uniref:Myb-like domain-containing protein n=1 Tax=Solanum pinnatisectum TaxID=50273 RepID=A0AAV9MAR3_9SOLN|nr:hypothetical protein R3W88_009329 [Solanum pinnatisectum]